jgi:hypothetical protein
MACQEAIEANPEKMEPHPGGKEVDSVELGFIAMHRKAPMEDAVVKPVRGRKKQHRGQHLAARQHREPKELTRGDCGSQRKLAAACRKMSCHAAVAWRKRNILRNIWTKGNCGPQKELAAAGRKMTHCAKVAQRKGHGLQGRLHEGQSVEQGRKHQTVNKCARGTQK